MGSILVINAAGRETRVALVENGHIAEFYLERKKDKGVVGNIYKGRVVRVLPGMQAAFVDIGLEKAAFLYVSDVVYDPDFARAQFELTEGEHEEAPDVPEMAEGDAAHDAVHEAAHDAVHDPAHAAHEGGLSFEHGAGGDHELELEMHELGPGELAPPLGEPVRRITTEMPAIVLPADTAVVLAAEAAVTPPPPTPSASEQAVAAALAQVEGSSTQLDAPVTIGAPEANALSPAELDAKVLLSGPHRAAELAAALAGEPADLPPSGPAQPLSPETAGVVPVDAPAIEGGPALERVLAPGSAPADADATAGAAEAGAPAADPGASPAGAPDARGERRTPRDAREQRMREKQQRRQGKDERRGDKAREREREEEKQKPRKTARIEDLLKVGQEVVVQISKDPIGTKGARLTSHISIPGRHLVFMPTVDHVGISRRIGNEKERRRLRELVDRLRPPGTGFIVRTVAENVPAEKLETDIRFLIEVWNQVVRKNEKRGGPGLLHPDLDLILRATRDLFAHDVEKLVIDDRDEYERVLGFVTAQDPALRDRVILHEGEEPVFDAYGIEQEINRAVQRKVWLKSGGYLIIDQAEALTAIDVNSGRYVGKKSLEETITKINVEAAKEIVYQLRLRNIGGIIICDFIDMEKAQNRDKVFKTLQEALGRDKAKTNVLKISELGLVEMTRKRVRESIGRILHEDCAYCDGRGFVKTATTVCYEIFREIRREAPLYKDPTLVINCNADVARLLQGDERNELRHLMDRYNKSIQVKAQQNYHREQYDIYGRSAQGQDHKLSGSTGVHGMGGSPTPSRPEGGGDSGRREGFRGRDRDRGERGDRGDRGERGDRDRHHGGGRHGGRDRGERGNADRNGRDRQGGGDRSGDKSERNRDRGQQAASGGAPQANANGATTAEPDKSSGQ